MRRQFSSSEGGAPGISWPSQIWQSSSAVRFTCCWFIKEKDGGIGDQPTSYTEPPPFTAGEASHRYAPGQDASYLASDMQLQAASFQQKKT